MGGGNICMFASFHEGAHLLIQAAPTHLFDHDAAEVAMLEGTKGRILL